MLNGLLAAIFVFIALIASPLVLRALVHRAVARHVCKDLAKVPKTRIALVLGSGLKPDGSPTPMLYDRVVTAVNLYKSGVIKELLMSGDYSSVNYNEPAVMKALAVQMGVSEEAIILDFSGRRTYDSCYRARHVFRVEQAVVVTQMFHLDRSLYYCRALGIESVGVPADRQPYGSVHPLCWLRETPALVSAWLDVNIFRPLPPLGKGPPRG